jgi:Icc-related predicted phosphoesterase
MVKLLVLSDLHLEFAPFEPETAAVAAADIVVLAGDIHKGVRGIEWARTAFADKPIIYVAGNHEFYGQHWTRLLDKLHEAAEKHGVHFLENEAVEKAGVRFLGCSLWTDFDLFGAEAKRSAMVRAQSNMNDYRQIKIYGIPESHLVHSQRLVPELTVQRHRESVQWLEKNLEENDGSKTVVVTHHAPHPSSIHLKFADDSLNPAFASNLARLMGKAALWIHGHMHDSANYVVAGTRVICNPRGYPLGTRGFENDAFESGLVVEL